MLIESEKNMKRAMFLVATLIFSPTILASCPIGSYEWIDSWGNKICKDFDFGDTKSIEGSTDNCPTGTYSWIDSWGNKICKSFDTEEEYHDTSKGCPAGTYQWIDDWGNKVCKSF